MRNANHLSAIGRKRLKCSKIGRARGQYNISGINEYPCTHIDSLLGRRSDLHSLHRHSASLCNGLSELLNALSGTILKSLSAIFVYDFRHRLLYRLQRKGLSRGVSSGKRVYRIEIDLLEDIPYGRPEEGINIM